MSLFASLYNLLFDQKTFFKENAPKGLKVPLLITAVYALAAGLLSLPALIMASSAIPAGMGGAVVVTGVITTVFTIFITWIFVSLLFFACLKFIGYAECSFKDVLSICSYVSVILIISTVFMMLLGLIGTAPAILLLALEGVFLLWSIPVWYFGFASITNIPEKKLKLCIAIPVILMVVSSLFSLIGA